MSYEESTLVCALFPDRSRAESAVRTLAEQGIEARVAEPGPRLNGIPPGSWEVRVPMGQAARARALLSS